MATDFVGRRVFITGGTSGIGKATALELVRRGAHVTVCGRDRNRLEATLIALNSKAGARSTVRGLALDVTDEGAVRRELAQLTAEQGPFDVLINNAGITHPAAAIDTPSDTYRSLMDTNYFGAVHVTRALLPDFIAQKGGHIAAVISVAGFMGVFGYSAYAASKFALHGFFDCLRQELRPHAVQISLLFPGDTDTPQLAEENPKKPAETRAVAGNVRVLSAERVARSLLDGMARGDYHIVPGREAKLAYFAQRYAPAIVRRVVDREVARATRELG